MYPINIIIGNKMCWNLTGIRLKASSMAKTKGVTKTDNITLVERQASKPNFKVVQHIQSSATIAKKEDSEAQVKAQPQMYRATAYLQIKFPLYFLETLILFSFLIL